MLKLYFKAQTLLADLKEDREGATIIEYSLLIGLLTVAIVGAVVLMGGWLLTQWQALCTATTVAGC